MSPYRVLVKDSKGAVRLLVAMLSIEPLTKRRRIFIVEKSLPQMWKSTPDEIKHLAHMQITRKNTLMLAEYAMYKDPMGLKYTIISRNNGDARTLSSNQYIQSDCLVAAMGDYTSGSGIEIIQQL